ncbi:MAG: DoxX family protein [Planctomycetes bacterium]|jgi:uncharacterized membrane protein YphA (DoxX/SURF4 family)|nr:DoxX family protein [Planctomycetota bacterium]
MKKVVLIARFCMGLPLFVLGLNGFLEFMEVPGEHPADALSFLHALGDSIYLFPLVNGIEVLCGLLLLLGAFVPLALVLMAPLLVNFVCFHVFLDDPQNGKIAYILVGLELFLVLAYGSYFRGFFSPRAKSRFQ